MRMRLTLDSLQKVVARTLDEEKASAALKGEIKRVLGPAVVTEGKLEEVAANANSWIDVLERTGRDGRFDFLSTVTTGFLDHRHPEVRKFAARVVPERFLGKLTTDNDSAVRAAVAQRVPLAAVREMMKRFKNDDQLRTIYRKRKLHEGGLAQPKVEPMGLDVPAPDAKRLGDAAKTPPGPELSEAWYNQHAHRFLHDFGRNIEYAWEPLAVRRFASSLKATSGVEIDEAKLLKTIKELIKEKEDLAMERNALRETLTWLDKQANKEQLDESVLPELDEVDDPVRKLVNAGLTGEQYVEQAKVLFRVQESQLPRSIRKYRLGEGNTAIVTVPCIGYMPSGKAFRAIDERALDVFCESWTKRQQLVGEPIRLEWVQHPGDQSKVCFTCVLK
jgi:regulator of replication initiation timing